MNRRIVLIDMDNTVADFNRGILEELRKRHGDVKLPSLDEIATFYIAESLPIELRQSVADIYNSTGFYETLPLMDDHVTKAIPSLASYAQVFFCTSPLGSNPYCLDEKRKWIGTHFGTYFANKRLVITKDKTLVQGDYLVDDRPSVEGLLDPTCEHVLFDRACNRSVEGKRRIKSWSEWERILS